MRGERRLLRLGEYLVGRACKRLPQDVREERCREWAAELPVILHDPQVRLAPWRAARMLGADGMRHDDYDAATGTMVLFGGFNAQGLNTWTWG